MCAGHCEVAPLTVHLNGGFRVWCSRYAPPQPTWNSTPHKDMDSGGARRVFSIALESVKIGLRPGVNAAILMNTVIQVHPGVIPVEHIANPIVSASALRLDSLGIGGPGLRVIGLGPSPCQGVVGDFGQLVFALLFAPAHPLWVRLQFFQGRSVARGRNVCVLVHVSRRLSLRNVLLDVTQPAEGQVCRHACSLCCSIQASSFLGWTRRAPSILTEGRPLGRCLSSSYTLTLLRPRIAATSVTVSSFSSGPAGAASVVLVDFAVLLMVFLSKQESV